ncbi:MAG: hypothetical protein DRJ44_04825 [Thermoprotei archaeon]|nr:MAG: hypothetical protein DRJ44_04825 [Thermoprotei archaeon]
MRIKSYIFFLLPSFTLISLFILYPIIFTIFLSLHKWDGLSPMKYVGLENYEYIFNWRTFWLSFKNNVVWMLIHMPISLILGLALAVLLRQRIVARNVARTIIFIGMVIPDVVAGIIWMFVYDPRIGMVNAALEFLGFKSHGWLTDPKTAIYAMIIASIWVWTGFTMTTYIAALEEIPRELYEVARIDGASSWQIFRHITLPLLKPATVTTVVLTMIWDLKIFGLVYVLGGRAVPEFIYVLAYLVYKEAFIAFHMGRASAIAIMLTLIVLLSSAYMIRRMVKT